MGIGGECKELLLCELHNNKSGDDVPPEENSELLVSGEFILLGKLHHSKYGDDDVQLGNLFPYLCLWHRK